VVGFSCGRNNDLPGSIKDTKFLDQLRDFMLLKQDSAPWSELIKLDIIFPSMRRFTSENMLFIPYWIEFDGNYFCYEVRHGYF
jgi:hypothetical protein